MSKLVEILKVFDGRVVTVVTPSENFAGRLTFSDAIGWHVKYGTEKFQPLIAGFYISIEPDTRLKIFTANTLEHGLPNKNYAAGPKE